MDVRYIRNGSNDTIIDLPNSKSLNLKLFIDITKLDINNCKSIALTVNNNNALRNYAGKVYQFEETVRFNSFHPVLFIDNFGIAAFHYMQKKGNQESLDEKGTPLRYCWGSLFSEAMFTLEKRPICPTQMVDNRIHGKGIITVYKPNIVAISRSIQQTNAARGFLGVHTIIDHW